MVIEEYINAVDHDVHKFIEDVINGDDKISYITVAFLSEDTSHKIEELTQKQVDGNRVVLDTNAVRHIINRHGIHGEHDNSMSDIDDLSRIGYAIMNYDDISFNGFTTSGYLDENGKPSPLIRISKKIDGTFYVVEAVNSSKKKKNYVVTAYINNAKKQPSNP